MIAAEIEVSQHSCKSPCSKLIVPENVNLSSRLLRKMITDRTAHYRQNHTSHTRTYPYSDELRHILFAHSFSTQVHMLDLVLNTHVLRVAHI
jgi:hypothetical protein